VDAEREAQLKQEMEVIERKLKDVEQRVKTIESSVDKAEEAKTEKERSIVSNMCAYTISSKRLARSTRRSFRIIAIARQCWLISKSLIPK
jgi:hypothetical protein